MASKKSATKKAQKHRRIPTPPSPKTDNQKHFIWSIDHKDITLATGFAGVGKTYLSACYAGYFYLLGKCNQIILTRPNVSTGKSLGAFPGTLEEKMEPWTVPFVSVLEGFLSKEKVEMMFKNKQIQIVPFEVIRGRSFDQSFVILDEAQNTSPDQMKSFVTRHGVGSTTIISGDPTQTDIKGENGMYFLKELLNNHEELEEYFGVVNFTVDDIVRSPVCKALIKAFL